MSIGNKRIDVRIKFLMSMSNKCLDFLNVRFYNENYPISFKK